MDEASVSMKAFIEDVSDPRIDRTKRRKLVDILVISLCAVVADSGNCTNERRSV